MKRAQRLLFQWLSYAPDCRYHGHSFSHLNASMKTTLFCLSLLLCGTAFAGELEDAHALLAKKDYAQAARIYTKLAGTGNPDAQHALGQMLWQGQAGPADEARAEALFKKAAGKGSKPATASLELLEQRVKRRAEIDYWVKGYDGEDLKSGEFRCVTPRIPAMSKINADIDRIGAAVAAWQACYNRFVTNLNAAMPLAKLVPPDVARLMSADEAEQSATHLGQVQANLSEEAKVASKLLLADFAAWRTATEAYVAEHNEMVKSAKKDSHWKDNKIQ
jgi:uncharacterized protein